MKKLNVEIVTPSKKYFEGSAYMVVVPGISGSVGFLPGHVPYTTQLSNGIIVVSDTASSFDMFARRFQIDGGYVQVRDDKVIVLAEDVKNNH